MQQQPFLLNFNNADFLSRRRRYVNRDKRNNWIVLLLGCLVGAVVTFSYGAWGNRAKENRFQTKGVNTQGSVIERKSSQGRWGTGYNVTYLYSTTNGEKYVHAISVDAASYDSTFIGSTVRLRYVSDNPIEAEIAGHSDLPAAIGCLILGFLCIGGAAYPFSRIRRLDRLSRFGQIFPAIITTANMSVDTWSEYTNAISKLGSRPLLVSYDRQSNQRWWLNINFVFRTPDSIEHRGKHRQLRNGLHGAFMFPAQNTSALVLYLDDKNYTLL